MSNWLNWINSNPILFAGFCTIISALISAFATLRIERLRIERKKGTNDAAYELKKEKRIQEKERNIDKSYGTIYVETLSSRKKREICGFCWEKEHMTIPLYTAYCTSDRVIFDTCKNCDTYCKRVPRGGPQLGEVPQLRF